MGFHRSQQANQGGDDPEGNIVDRELLEAGEQTPALLGPTDYPLDDVPPTVLLLVEVGVARLVLAGRDDPADPSAAQPPPDARVAVPLVAGQPLRPPPAASSSGQIHSLHGRLERLALVPLAAGNVDAQHGPLAVAQQVDLGAEATPGVAQRMICWLFE